MRYLLVGLLLTGCTTTQDERICIDYKIISYESDKCVPLYGDIICHEVIKKDVICTRYVNATSEREKPEDHRQEHKPTT